MHRTSLRTFNTMMTRLTSLLYFLGTLLIPGLCCNWMKQYSHLNNQSLSLIQLMGDKLSQEESPVPFPQKLYKSMKNAEPKVKMIFIREGLEMIFQLYACSNCTAASWDSDKMDHFRIIIHRQVEELNKCVPTEKRNSQLQKYFRRLKNRTLRHTGDSNAAWELIRSETKYHLEQLQFLAFSAQAPLSNGGEHVTAFSLNTLEHH